MDHYKSYRKWVHQIRSKGGWNLKMRVITIFISSTALDSMEASSPLASYCFNNKPFLPLVLRRSTLAPHFLKYGALSHFYIQSKLPGSGSHLHICRSHRSKNWEIHFSVVLPNINPHLNWPLLSSLRYYGLAKKFWLQTIPTTTTAAAKLHICCLI